MPAVYIDRQVDYPDIYGILNPFLGPDGTLYGIYASGPPYDSVLYLSALAPGATAPTSTLLQNSNGLAQGFGVFDPSTNTIWFTAYYGEVVNWDLSGNCLSYGPIFGTEDEPLQPTGPNADVGTQQGNSAGCPVIGPDGKVWIPYVDNNNHVYVAVVDPNTPGTLDYPGGYTNPKYTVAYGFDENSNSAIASSGGVHPAACTDGEYVYVAGGLSQGSPTGGASIAYIYRVAVDGSFVALPIPGIGPGGSTVAPINSICLGPAGTLLYAGNHQNTEQKITLGVLDLTTESCVESQYSPTANTYTVYGLCYESDTGAVWLMDSQLNIYYASPGAGYAYTITPYSQPNGTQPQGETGATYIVYDPVSKLVYEFPNGEAVGFEVGQGGVAPVAPGTATLTAVDPVSYTLEILPQPTGGLTYVPVRNDHTFQFFAHRLGSDGSDTIVTCNWSTNAGTIDGTGLLTPSTNVLGDDFEVTASLPAQGYNPAISDTVDVGITCPPSGQIQPNAPTILSVSQASMSLATGGSKSILAFGVAQAKTTGLYPIVSLRVYRGATAAGPFSLVVDTEPISNVTIVNNLFDQNPVFGSSEYYVATAIDSMGMESGYSNVVSYSASAAKSVYTSNLSSAAFGKYPLLGSDCYLDPTTREGVIGPNGDLLTVNSLECLAQDLRIRILTEYGELPLHQEFGFSKGKVIGSGQANPSAEAVILVADVKDLLRKEPRVLSILDVNVTQVDGYSWTVQYDIQAIGYEDSLKANLVFPYYT